MAKAPGGPVGDPLLVSTFALSGTKKRLMLYENGISVADVSRHSKTEDDEFIHLSRVVAAEAWPCCSGGCGQTRAGGERPAVSVSASAACLVTSTADGGGSSTTVAATTATGCYEGGGGGGRVTLGDPALRLHVAKPAHRHSWCLQTLVLRGVSGRSSDHALAHQWADAVQDRLRGVDRPRKLLVFVNPFGGRKRAPVIYQRKVAPIFQMAGISVELITTRYAGHAKECLLELDLSLFDGVVCVGGDGMVNEIVNGVLLRAQRDAGVDANDPNSRLQPGTIKIGVIPAGSTDALVCTTTGENSPVTSALLIAMGAEIGVDVASIHSGERLVRYSSGFLSYGFFGDNIKASEKFRWMGPLRYNWTGWQTFLKHHVYEGELKLLVQPETTDANYDPAGTDRCRAGCEVCHTAPGDIPLQVLNTSDIHAENKPYWLGIQGHFLSVSCALMANRCARSTAGVAPTAHLGNGLMDVVLVSQCSRRNFLRFLVALANSETCSPFKFPFVHCFRTSCLEFVPKTPDSSDEGTVKHTGSWQCDGELLPETSLLVRSHRQLLKLYAHGIEERDEHRSDRCFCSCH
ncbi:ceramide kinase [Dermacentor variabilis]|uniref:ceramide kinase n=1 Tax=Dermacentor variabilis TaxID=34621 RepID=UPI003F5C9F9A